MKNTARDFQLSINEPCHENWDRMLPDEKGKFCLSCQKVVHDFTQKTKEEIIEFFRLRKFQTVCARVNDEVLLAPPEAGKNLFRKRSTLRLAWFAYVLFIVFGSALFSCNVPVQRVTPEERHLLGVMIADLPASMYQEEKESKVVPALDKLQQEKKAMDARLPSEVSDTLLLPEILVEASNIQWAKCGTAGALTISYYISYEDTARPPAFPHSPLGKEAQKSVTAPDEPSLEVFPNPSTGQFQIRYKLITQVPVEMDIYNISGQFIDRIISSQQQEGGEYIESFNLEGIAAGIYFIRMQMGENALTRRLVIAR